MKNRFLPIWNYIKLHWITLLILCIGAYFFVISVRKTVNEVAVAQSDTTRYVTQITQPTIYQERYTPFIYKSKDTIKEVVIVPQKYIPSEDIKELRQQVVELSTKLFKVNRYKDTIFLKDTAGTVVGNVNLDDSITQNMIASRGVNYSLKFPRETLTITNTIVPPPKTQVFIGPDVSVSAANYFNQAGMSAILKTKKDNVFRGGIGFQNLFQKPQVYFSAGYYPKISLK